MKPILYIWAALIAAAGSFLAPGPPASAADPDKPAAVAVLHPTKGNQVNGEVKFLKNAGGTRIVADLKGLTPGRHGFHVHEFGDCSAADATSAGGHFNPTNQPHAAPTDAKRHMGDLGNIEAQSDGSVHLEMTDKMMKLEGPQGVIGRAVVVHAGVDDLKSQPAGDSGARVACGVIGYAKK